MGEHFHAKSQPASQPAGRLNRTVYRGAGMAIVGAAAQPGASIVLLLPIVLLSLHFIEIGNVQAQIFGKHEAPPMVKPLGKIYGYPPGYNQGAKSREEPRKPNSMNTALGRTHASMGPPRVSSSGSGTNEAAGGGGHTGHTTEAPQEQASSSGEQKTTTTGEGKLGKDQERPGSPFWDAISQICGNFTRTTAGKGPARGKQIEPKHYPSYASISLKSKTGGAKCSGVLVSNRHVLTVVDCPLKFDGPKNELANITVIFGAPERTKKADEQDEDGGGSGSAADTKLKGFRIDRVTRIQGPMCSNRKRTYSYRVIILKLFEEVEFDLHRQPACLPNDNGNEFPGDREATLVGRHSAKEGSNRPLKRLAAIKSKKTACPDSYSGGVSLCMKPAKQDGGTCEGDLGAPLLAENEKRKHTVVGLLTRNSPDCEPGDKGTSGFADLSVVATAIKKSIDQSYQPRYDKNQPHRRASNRCLG